MFKRYQETYKLPFNSSIPNYCNKYESKINNPSRFFKYLKRYLYLYLNQQIKYEKKFISSDHKRILWINKSAPSLGDSLMDLSSRVLLQDREIDLLTDKKNKHIYTDDPIFNEVYTSAEGIDKKKYDLVILDSYSSRTIKLKIRALPFHEFVSIYGFFNGPEINRILFSFHRVNFLLRLNLSHMKINSLAFPSMNFSKPKNLKLPQKFITLAVGGEWEYRTFKNWEEVVKKLLNKYDQLLICLVGSKNGIDHALKIHEFFPNRVLNFVGKYSFKETAFIISRSKVFLGCDGGLLHVANSFRKITIPLFSRVEPELRMTEGMISFPIYDSLDVNNIKIDSIVYNFEEALKAVDKYHPAE